jgi:Flp pilus assembly pilin Flp
VNSLGRTTLLLMIPLNLLLIAWVWIGRIVFGVGGWFFLVFLISVVPVLLLAFLVTTILAYTQHGRPRSLTRTQAVAQVVTWLALFVAGAFMPDFGDTDDSHISLLTQLFGRSNGALDVSYTIVLAAGAVAVVAYVVLLVALVAGRRTQQAADTPESAGRLR